MYEGLTNMTVGDILPKRDRKKTEFENLQKLERYFTNHPEEAEELADKLDLTMSLPRLLTEVRMEYYDVIAAIDKKIENAVIQD